jgi:steroid delta-isomerase-like uncharacterized protein
MPLEENKVIVRRLVEAINKRNLDSLDSLMMHNFCYHTQSQNIQGLDVIKQVVKDEVEGFPDLHVTIEDIIAEGDKVWVRLEQTGTHTGEFRGLSPTGKKIKYSTVAIWRVANGKIVEGWGVYDFVDYYRELGVIEYTKKGRKFFSKEA